MGLKICSKCKQEKSTTEFFKNKNRSDGYNGWCKNCLKPLIKKHKSTEQYKKQARDYANKPETRKRGNYLRRKRRASNPEKYRRRDKIERNLINPNKRRARQAVNNAINFNKFPKASEYQCYECKNKAEEYHHPSYKREHWFVVIPLCRLCHARVHNQ